MTSHYEASGKRRQEVSVHLQDWQHVPRGAALSGQQRRLTNEVGVRNKWAEERGWWVDVGREVEDICTEDCLCSKAITRDECRWVLCAVGRGTRQRATSRVRKRNQARNTGASCATVVKYMASVGQLYR